MYFCTAGLPDLEERAIFAVTPPPVKALPRIPASHGGGLAA
jgi:hypothetical protein